LLSELIDRSIDYLSSGWSKGKRNVNEIDIRPRLRLFIDVIGDKKAGALSKEDVLLFKEIVPESVFRQI
jgi:hypothetical protein